jgi:uncharacterized membrane protein
MADDSNDQLVLGYFASKDLAEQAADALKAWDKSNDDVKAGAIAVLSKNSKGKMETTKLERNTGKGAKLGVITGAIVGVLSGGLSVLVSAFWGLAVGAGAGAASKKGIGLSEEELHHLGDELTNGHAALLVVVDKTEADGVTAEVRSLGGTAQASEVSPEAIAQAQQALNSAPTATTPAATTPDATATPAPTDPPTAPTATPTNTPTGSA